MPISSPAHAPTTTPSPRKQYWGVFASLTVYLLLAIWLNIDALWHGPSHWISGGYGGDGGQEIWFLHFFSYAVLHGQNPFATALINVPHGVNVANMTSMPIIGLAAMPFSAIAGPVFAYNMLMLLGVWSSAVAMFFAVRRMTTRVFSAFTAGALFGFSPFVIGQSAGHLFLVTVGLFPIIFLLLHEVLVRQRWSPWLVGGLLGLVFTLQVGISPEMLTDAGLLLVAGAVLTLLARPRLLLRRTPYLMRAVGTIVAVMVIPFGLYLYEYLLGPHHIHGAVRPASFVAALSSTVATFIVPGSNQWLNLGLAHWLDQSVYYGVNHHQLDPVENGSYLGLPLVGVIGWAVWRLRRRGLVQLLTLLLVISAVFSLGAQLRFHVGTTGLYLPFAALVKLPLFNSTLAIRWALFTAFFGALLVALLLDDLPLHRTNRLSAVTLAVVSMVFLAPPRAIPAAPLAVPAWFTSPAVATLAPQSALLTYPMAMNGYPEPMMWQAVADFHFSLVGGEAGSQTVHLGVTNAALAQCQTTNQYSSVWLWQIKNEFIAWHLRTIVVPNGFAANESCAVGLFTAATGRAPVYEYDAWVWHDLPTGQ